MSGAQGPGRALIEARPARTTSSTSYIRACSWPGTIEANRKDPVRVARKENVAVRPLASPCTGEGVLAPGKAAVVDAGARDDRTRGGPAAPVGELHRHPPTLRDRHQELAAPVSVEVEAAVASVQPASSVTSTLRWGAST